jgi:hypothetical protein
MTYTLRLDGPDGTEAVIELRKLSKVPYHAPKPRTHKGKVIPPAPDPMLYVWAWVSGEHTGEFTMSESDGPLRAARRALTDLIVATKIGFYDHEETAA